LGRGFVIVALAAALVASVITFTLGAAVGYHWRRAEQERDAMVFATARQLFGVDSGPSSALWR
jgi:hypothetical protein